MALQASDNALSLKVLSILTIGLFPTLSWGQANLVPNPSFEEYNFCSNQFDGAGWANDWFVPPDGLSPDYFNSCSNVSSVSVPLNAVGSQSPMSGNAYVGIFSFSENEPHVREAISCMLTSPLLESKSYVFKAYFSLADEMEYAVSSLGYLLTESSLQAGTAINTVSPTWFNEGSVLTDTENWMLLTDTIEASGGEKFLTIANFLPDELSDTMFVGGRKHQAMHITTLMTFL